MMRVLFRQARHILTILQQQSQATRTDKLLLRWGILSVVVMGCTMGMLLSGLFNILDEVQLHVLLGRPFLWMLAWRNQPS